jgi:phage tail protein X
MVHKYKSYYDYVALPGDRLDRIAYKFYGNTFLIRPIAEVNPEVLSIPFITSDLNSPIIPAGTRLRIPQIEARRYVDPESLPPWRRISIEELRADQLRNPTYPRIPGLN